MRRRALWRDGDFLRLWSGQTVSELGSQVTLLALPLTAILVLHASAFRVAVLSSIELVPFLLFGLAAGVWVDRLSYRFVLVAADLARAAFLGSVPLTYALGALTLAQLYVVGFGVGVMTVLFTCAYHAYLPSLLARERLLEANAKVETTRSIAQTAGPGAGGGLVSLLSAPTAILADALSFLASALLIFSIRYREPPKVTIGTRNLLAELREGMSHVWRHPLRRANLFSSGLANFSYGMTWAVLLVFAVRVLGLHPGVIGLILALGQAGGILGAVLARRIASTLGVGPTFILSIALCGPAALLMALATRATAIPFLALGWGIWSFSSLVSSVIGVSIRQAQVPQRLQGRVVGTVRSIIYGVAPLGSLAGGAIATALNLRAALLASAIVSSFAFVPLLFSPARTLRELPPLEPDPAEPLLDALPTAVV